MVIEEIMAPELEEHYFGIEWIATDNLMVDPTYQRPMVASMVKVIADAWDWKAVRTLAVSLRKGENGANYYAVIDGQQRLTAARECNVDRLPCQVYIDLTPEQEAALFLKLNNSRKPTANDMFRAKLANGDAEAKMLVRAIEDSGFELDLTNAKGGAGSKTYGSVAVNSITSVLHAYRSGGIMHLRSVLNILHGWHGQHLAVSADMITGISEVLLRHRGKVEMSRLTKVLADETPTQIVGMAIQLIAGERAASFSGSKRSDAICRVIVNKYNKGLRLGKLE